MPEFIKIDLTKGRRFRFIADGPTASATKAGAFQR